MNHTKSFRKRQLRNDRTIAHFSTSSFPGDARLYRKLLAYFPCPAGAFRHLKVSRSFGYSFIYTRWCSIASITPGSDIWWHLMGQTLGIMTTCWFYVHRCTFGFITVSVIWGLGWYHNMDSRRPFTLFWTLPWIVIVNLININVYYFIKFIRIKSIYGFN